MNDPISFWEQWTRLNAHIEMRYSNVQKSSEIRYFIVQNKWRYLDDEKYDDERNNNSNDDWRCIADNKKSSDDTEKVCQDIYN